MGALAVAQHTKSACHKTKTIDFALSSVMDSFLDSSSVRDNFVVKKNSKVDIVVASEIAQIYHVIKHNHSYNSLDCGLKLNSKIYQDSNVAAEVSCGLTKCEAIVTNVIGEKA